MTNLKERKLQLEAEIAKLQNELTEINKQLETKNKSEKEIIVNENLNLFKEYDFTPNEHGYIGYTFHDAKRWASAKVQENEKGIYFIRKNVKYYISVK